MSEKDNSYRPGTPDFSQVLSRRRFIKQSALAAGAVGLGLSLPSFGPSAEAADIARFAGETTYELPVTHDERDVRLRNIKIPRIRLDKSMQESPSHLPVIDVGFNPKFTEWEAKNRLGIATANALIRAHMLASETIGEGYDTSKLQTFLNNAQPFEDPNWSDYMLRIQSGEELLIPMMVYPDDSNLDPTNRKWVDINLKESVTFNFTSDPNQAIGHQFVDVESAEPIDGYTLRHNDKNGLIIDIYANTLALKDMFPDLQVAYDLTLATTMRRALAVMETSLGVFTDDTTNLYGKHVIKHYGEDINWGNLFPEQSSILLGNLNEIGTSQSELLPHTFFAGK